MEFEATCFFDVSVPFFMVLGIGVLCQNFLIGIAWSLPFRLRSILCEHVELPLLLSRPTLNSITTGEEREDLL